MPKKKALIDQTTPTVNPTRKYNFSDLSRELQLYNMLIRNLIEILGLLYNMILLISDIIKLFTDRKHYIV